MKNFRPYLVLIGLILACGITGFAQAKRSQQMKDDYKLQEVVILSRYNIRSPLSGNGSALGNMTPHQWIEWTSAPSELTSRGGVLETIMGQYFRKWLADEGLMDEGYVPTPCCNTCRTN